MARPRSVSDEEILDAVAGVVGRLGIGRFTLADVAAEVGLVPATLIQRFGSKRRLLLAFSEHASGGAAGPFLQARREAASPVEALLRALLLMVTEVRTPEQMMNHLNLLQMDVGDADFRQYAVSHARTVRAGLTMLLREAIASGELTNDDPDRLARMVQAVYNGSMLTWALYRQGGLEEWLRSDVEAVLAPYRAGAQGRE